MLQTILIFLILGSGYLVKHPPLTEFILNKILLVLIALILFVMGYHFGSNSNFFVQIANISHIVTIITMSLLISNYLLFTIINKIFINKRAINTTKHNQNNADNNLATNFLSYLLASFTYLIYTIIGIAVGYILKIQLNNIALIVNTILLIIIFIIGMQLRQQNMPLKTIFLNKFGIIIALTTTGASTISSIITSKLLHITLSKSFALSCGFGWYTLSTILSGNLANATMSSAAFFIDFFREILAIIIIPCFSKNNPLFCIGYSGATALDFTLPMIQSSIGKAAVPLAITSGIILTILMPILISAAWTLAA